MYFLKKLTSFTKTANTERAEETVTGSRSRVDVASETNKENTEGSVHASGLYPKKEHQKTDSSDLSGSDPSIPDCFFDDVPETASSDGISSEESRDIDEGVMTDVSNDNVENCDRLQNLHAEPSSCRVSINCITDDSGKKTEDLNADVVDFRNGNNESHVNIAKVAGEKIEESEKEDDGRGTDVVDVEKVEIPSEEMLGTSEAIFDEIQLKMDEDDIDPECAIEIVGFFDRHESQQAQSSLNDDQMIKYDLAEDNRGEVDYDDDEDDDDVSVPFSSRRTSGMGCLEDYLEKENEEAEARLDAKRQARVEAREIRLRELERQQKEQEENADRAFDMSYVGDSILRRGRITPSGTTLTPRDRSVVTANSYHSSRRSSEDSVEEGLTLRDIRHELKETEEKFKKAMIANAQLDNEKSALAYQVELLKDHFEDLEETHAQLTREHRDKCREHEHLKRAMIKLKEDLDFYKSNLIERDRLIAEYGLVVVDGEEDSEGKPKRTLVSAESAELLQQAGSGSLDVRLKKFSEEKNELQDEIRHLKLELEEERSKRISDSGTGHGSLTNGPLDEETNKILSDYKFKLQKAEQDVSTLQANVARLESQVIRYKTAAESSEKAEDELKIEKRKLQRENRESIARIEELETANSHLQRRMDKLKNAKSTLLKEL